MAETARAIIYDALRMIYVTGDEEPVEAPDLQRAIRVLNRMMAEFLSEGIDLSYVDIISGTDAVDVDAGAYSGIIANLAVRLWPYYHKSDPSMMLISIANKGKEDLFAIGLVVDEMDYPDTLPVGSGNETSLIYNSDHFFPANEEV